jgi:hypothetical protein
MYLGCLFCLFVYVELFRIFLKLNGLYLFPCTINCQTRVEALAGVSIARHDVLLVLLQKGLEACAPPGLGHVG